MTRTIGTILGFIILATTFALGQAPAPKAQITPQLSTKPIALDDATVAKLAPLVAKRDATLKQLQDDAKTYNDVLAQIGVIETQTLGTMGLDYHHAALSQDGKSIQVRQGPPAR